ncbi:MAG: hypothetical protein U9Q82_04000 [Chloroflexota bacterium]|nr:hypothetical protein [Chloroflexota bacterium]
MLTIFSTPKPFTDAHINIIQRNAIQSWLHLGADVEVLLIGKEAGLPQVAAEFGVEYLPDVARNQWDTPLVSSIFALARENSKSRLLAYVNADILLRPDFVDVARQVAAQARNFLVVGQRWDLDVTREMDFGPNWDSELRSAAHTRGSLHAPSGSDYFIFPRSTFTQIPNFAIGRAGWDNWMIYHALQQKWPVVDATSSLMIVHQSHDYAHLPGGQMHYDLEETKINAALGGGMRNMYMTLDASHEFVDGRLRRARPSRGRLLRKLERWMQPEQQQGIRWSLTRRLRRWRRKLVR